MSKKYPGGIIRGTPITPTTTAASGVWTVCQAQNYTRQGIWPRSPGAPTIGTATDTTSGGAVSVAFTAPTDIGSAAITSYIATSSPGGVTGTAASSPITVSGLTNGTAYTFSVRATNGAGTGPASTASNSVTPTLVVVGQQAFITAGTFSWVAPAGVTSVSVVAIGGGGNFGAGGGLGYRNNQAVTPGSSYTVVVGAGGFNCGCAPGRRGVDSSFINTSIVRGGGGGGGGSGGNLLGGTFTGTGGGGGGNNNGGGAGGYAGNGGNAGGGGAAGAGGAGGGGGFFQGSVCCTFWTRYGAGGGVGILGQGANGAAGGGGFSNGGGGGSGGANASNGDPGLYGGGGGGVFPGCGQIAGARGAVRIIWPGTTRSFPSTNTGNL